MGWRAFVVLVLLALLAVFVAFNWAAFVEPTTINLVAREFEAPLGLIMLGVVVFLTVVFLLFTVSIRTQSVVQARRLLSDLESARKLAEDAEQSRLVELRDALTTELEAVRAAVAEQAEETRAGVESSTNVLAAHLGQIDEFLKINSDDLADAEDADDLLDAGSSDGVDAQG